ncbi:OsmC family protein [Acholeplasma vituli]|uniref:OsmC family protein n=1 Tax=Paracholeplasma vituli TaxID=69473 RepID=A0ABT2PXS3_9MOLU|nr:OsmC family protein [Paracholeplasma vituli]MCU0105756.1 OsmC family protein [Paracholeplasma vituli]
MKADTIHVKFDSNFVGEMTSPTGKIALGSQHNGMKPYHLLFGAVASCFYATFLSVAQKMRLTHTDVEIEVSGNKRDETPATLDHVLIKMVIYNGSDEAKLRRAADLGAQYCSIHETVSKVAKIDLEVTFKTK